MREPFAEAGESGAGLLTAKARGRPPWSDAPSVDRLSPLLHPCLPGPPEMAQPACLPPRRSLLSLSRRGAALRESHCVSDLLLLGPLASPSHKPSPASMSRWAGERLNKQYADLRAKNEAPVGKGRGLPWHGSGGAAVPTGECVCRHCGLSQPGGRQRARPLAPSGWTPSRAPAGPTVKNALVQMSAP